MPGQQGLPEEEFIRVNIGKPAVGRHIWDAFRTEIVSYATELLGKNRPVRRVRYGSERKVKAPDDKELSLRRALMGTSRHNPLGDHVVDRVIHERTADLESVPLVDPARA